MKWNLCPEPPARMPGWRTNCRDGDWSTHTTSAKWLLASSAPQALLSLLPLHAARPMAGLLASETPLQAAAIIMIKRCCCTSCVRARSLAQAVVALLSEAGRPAPGLTNCCRTLAKVCEGKVKMHVDRGPHADCPTRGRPGATARLGRSRPLPHALPPPDGAGRPKPPVPLSPYLGQLRSVLGKEVAGCAGGGCIGRGPRSWEGSRVRFAFCSTFGNRCCSSSGLKRTTSAKRASCASTAPMSKSKGCVATGSASGLWKATRYGCESACTTVHRCDGSQQSMPPRRSSASLEALGYSERMGLPTEGGRPAM
mmetsp:Transcript_13728/g.27597  ORF Transcript_13728/g.27597 Transcript_13728/m.27597 type:complete len:311 (-) Transcript_13728:169-1101(-)